MSAVARPRRRCDSEGEGEGEGGFIVQGSMGVVDCVQGQGVSAGRGEAGEDIVLAHGCLVVRGGRYSSK